MNKVCPNCQTVMEKNDEEYTCPNCGNKMENNSENLNESNVLLNE